MNVARSYAKSFWYVFRIAFPLMILAAVLGAVVIEVLPQHVLIAPVTFGGIVIVALVSAFLPVPMAFDVAIAYIAWKSGVPLPYVVTYSLHVGDCQRVFAFGGGEVAFVESGGGSVRHRGCVGDVGWGRRSGDVGNG